MNRYCRAYHVDQPMRLSAPFLMHMLAFSVQCIYARDRQLLHRFAMFQRALEQRPTQDETPPGLLLGTPAHCVLGGQPPWIAIGMGLSVLPHAFQAIARRQMAGRVASAADLFDDALELAYKRHSLYIPPSNQLRTFGVPRESVDVYAVWAGCVVNEYGQLDMEEFPLQKALAIHVCTFGIADDPDNADKFAEQIANMVVINFKDQVVS